MKASQKAVLDRGKVQLPIRVEEVQFEEDREQRFLSVLRRQSRPITPVIRRVA